MNDLVAPQVVSHLTTIEELLEQLCACSGACGAVYLGFDECQEQPWISSLVAVGETGSWNSLRKGTAPPGFDHDYSDEALAFRRGQWCLQAPAQRHFNRFCWLHHDIGLPWRWDQTPAFTALYKENGIGAQYRAVLVNNGIVAGWIGFFFRQSEPAGQRCSSAAIDAALPELRRLAIAVTEREREACRVLLGACGVVRTDGRALEMFGRDVLESLRTGSDPRLPAVWCRNQYRVSRIPMRGEDDDEPDDTQLLLLEPLPPLRVELRRALTDLQLAVANFIVNGFSNARAAEELGVQIDTIKYHLKNIYPILGVSNRVELASLLGGG